MEYKVIGIQTSNRTSKTTGREYVAVNLYCTYRLSSGEGTGCEAVFCTVSALCGDIRVGDRVRILYNKFGHVERVEKIID